MEVIYFYEAPKLDGYHFDAYTRFKYGVEITFFDEDGSWEKPWREFLFPLISTLIETYGADPEYKRYEFLMEDECQMYRVLFKDEEDQAAFKLLWPGEWDPDPVWSDDDEE